MNRNVLVIVTVVLSVTGILIAGKYAARQSSSTATIAGSAIKGALAPDFALISIDGKTVHLTDYRGKAVVLNFWATWCPPCRTEIPGFVELQRRYGPVGLEIVGITMDDAAEHKSSAIAKTASDIGINYMVLLGNDHVAEIYRVPWLPTTIFIGRDGRIISQLYGPLSQQDAERQIQGVLK